MNSPITRLAAFSIKNIKNVNYGTISMPSNGNFRSGKAEVLGIYGQNGSGKTAIIDSLFFLHRIMIGYSLPEELVDYISSDSAEAEMHAIYNVCVGNTVLEIGYNISIAIEHDVPKINREWLTVAKRAGNEKVRKTIFLDFRRNDKEALLRPHIRLKEYIGNEKERKTDIIVARKMAEKSNCSYVFGENSRDIFFGDVNEEFKPYAAMIQDLYYYALRDVFVIRNVHSGVISARTILPMAFRVENSEMGMKGDLVVSLEEPVVLNLEQAKLLDAIVQQINSVLYTIIPGLKIKVKDYGRQLMDSGEEGKKIELMSMRNGKKAIPIRMESEGIIKIISILGALIQAFGNPSVCLVIDELDSGIYEYMLGELLDVFAKNAKGQLIFTSHNLRALEMLDKQNIMFSTVNPDNRYIFMKNIRPTNNFRSTYIRSITLGGQEEKIYEETDSLEMARAFRKAGRKLQND